MAFHCIGFLLGCFTTLAQVGFGHWIFTKMALGWVGFDPGWFWAESTLGWVGFLLAWLWAGLAWPGLSFRLSWLLAGLAPHWVDF